MIVIAVCHVTRGGKRGWRGCSVVDCFVIRLFSHVDNKKIGMSFFHVPSSLSREQ
jgi:hypothetical protein